MSCNSPQTTDTQIDKRRGKNTRSSVSLLLASYSSMESSIDSDLFQGDGSVVSAPVRAEVLEGFLGRFFPRLKK